MNKNKWIAGLILASVLPVTQASAHVENNWALTQVEADKAWPLAKPDRNIFVAIIDTGVDISHPALKNHLWTNPGEVGIDSQGRDKSTNGIDDDGNGYADDVHGWNFVANNNDLSDHEEHGTHISGIITSFQGGADTHTKLMILKYYDAKAADQKNLEHTVNAIRYAIKMKANIINYSAGGLEKSRLEKQAIQEAAEKNIIFVAAAGNEKSNSDIKGFYPADYGLPNIISVTATDTDKQILDSSNYGLKSVDIAAPGKFIYSSLPGGRYGYMSGTSQACAFVSGALALLMASNIDLTDPQTIISRIRNSGEPVSNLSGKTKTSTLLNPYRALTMQDKGVSALGIQDGEQAAQSLFYPNSIWKRN